MIHEPKKNKYRINKSVYAIFIFYISLFYFVPLIVNLCYPDEYAMLYVGTKSKMPFLLVPLFLLLVYFMDLGVPNLRIIDFRPIGKLFESGWFNYIMILIFFALAINFSLKYSLNFRQSHETSIIAAGPEVIVMLALRSYATVYILYILLKRVNGLSVFKREKVLLMIITGGFIITITGSTDMLFILLSLLLIFNKEKLLFVKKVAKRKNFIVSFLKGILIMILLLVLISSVIFIGNANKIGLDKAVDIFTDKENLNLILVATSLRISNWYASLLAVGNRGFFNNSLAYNTIGGIIGNFFYQLGSMIGVTVVKPEVWSAARMNYLQTYTDLESSTTGSSPGLIASCIYIPFFPSGMFLLSFYTVAVLRNLSKAFSTANVKLNGLALVILMFFITSFFDSPLDMLNIFNPSVIIAIFFLAATNNVAYLNRKMRLEKDQIMIA